MTRLHPILARPSEMPLPGRFTYPFCYTPHPLCVRAAAEVRAYLSGCPAWSDELSKGKMFGVLIVRTPDGETAYLAAFSGTLAGQNDHPWFVPPVFDLLNPGGYFKKEEKKISGLNRRIATAEADPAYLQLRRQLDDMERHACEKLQQEKLRLKQSKAQRDLRRQSVPPPTAEELLALTRQSQHEKAGLRRLAAQLQAETDDVRARLRPMERAIAQLKQERRTRSAALQRRLFSSFVLLNAKGEERDLWDIFRAAGHPTPPAGAGECALPKLLQYAYRNGLWPVAMAEFWTGASPQGEVRHDGHFYPSCRGKCGPILAHMLQGLDVEDNPLQMSVQHQATPAVVYEDTWLLVLDKPAGMLSVPGKDAGYSAWQWVRDNRPEADGPLLVHRLDMDTSGLLLVAKTKAVHQQLQALFHHRHIQKTYVALLDGIVTQDEGRIELPVCPNPLDRPRQRVDQERGKPAVTLYKVLSREEGHTRILFQPLTGRTHQLRVHAAHPDGLHCPIHGDRLYGTAAGRLCLHAQKLEFIHPVTGQALCVECPPGF